MYDIEDDASAVSNGDVNNEKSEKEKVMKDAEKAFYEVEEVGN